MRTVGPKNKLLSTEVTGMDTNGYVIQNATKFAMRMGNGGYCGSAWGQDQEMEVLQLCMVTLEIKITVFTCMLSSEGCDSFPKHLDLALVLNKTNGGVEKQQNIW